jgi:hypothetical protein
MEWGRKFMFLVAFSSLPFAAGWPENRIRENFSDAASIRDMERFS